MVAYTLSCMRSGTWFASSAIMEIYLSAYRYKMWKSLFELGLKKASVEGHEKPPKANIAVAWPHEMDFDCFFWNDL